MHLVSQFNLLISRALHDSGEYEDTHSRDLYFCMNSVSSELLKTEVDPWEMIAMVWVEMLWYISHNHNHGFHARQLSAGGEFLAHAKISVSIFPSITYIPLGMLHDIPCV